MQVFSVQQLLKMRDVFIRIHVFVDGVLLFHYIRALVGKEPLYRHVEFLFVIRQLPYE